LMNKANWQTGLAGIIGVGGLGLGYWWTDPLAAIVISASVIWDGWNAMKIAAAELVDGIPHELDSGKLSKEASALARGLQSEFPEAKKILLRETGRYIRAEVVGARPGAQIDLDTLDIADCEKWRIDSVSFRA
jgi:cobalt-zinc-cadmium efflux system protein